MAKLHYMRDNRDGHIIATEFPENWENDAERILPGSEGKRLYRAQIVAELLARIEVGTRIYTNVEHVAASGMARRLRVFMVGADGRIADITLKVATAIEGRLHDDGSRWTIVQTGCGYDAGHDIVYRLGYALWPNGTPEPHGHRNGEPDREGGYALRHETL